MVKPLGLEAFSLHKLDKAAEISSSEKGIFSLLESLLRIASKFIPLILGLQSCVLRLLGQTPNFHVGCSYGFQLPCYGF